MKPHPETALAERAASTEPWHGPDWQKLWLSLQERRWKSLAIIPAAVGAPLDFTLNIAVNLARTGMMHLRAPIHVADATQVQLSNVVPFADEVRRYQSGTDMILLALAAPKTNPVTVNLVKETDGSLLCVLFERMDMSEAKGTVATIGRSHFLGSAIFHPGTIIGTEGPSG